MELEGGAAERERYEAGTGVFGGRPRGLAFSSLPCRLGASAKVRPVGLCEVDAELVLDVAAGVLPLSRITFWVGRAWCDDSVEVSVWAEWARRERPEGLEDCSEVYASSERDAAGESERPSSGAAAVLDRDEDGSVGEGACTTARGGLERDGDGMSRAHSGTRDRRGLAASALKLWAGGGGRRRKKSAAGRTRR